MIPSRRTQPYRKSGGRTPGMALTNMLRGRTTSGFNPADAKRAAFLVASAKRAKHRKRPPRPPRPARPQR